MLPRCWAPCSPTDAAAVAGLAKKLPRRSLTILRGESLINDGTALVLFGVTVSVAVGGGEVGPMALTLRFVYSYLGGIVAGLIVGGLVTLLRRRIDAPLEEGALSLLTPSRRSCSRRAPIAAVWSRCWCPR